MPSKISVLVTGVGGGGLGHEIVKCLRMTNSYHITGSDINHSSFGKYNTDDFYVVPKAIHPNYISSIIDICKKSNITVLIPGSDPELNIFSKHRYDIESEGIFLPINTSFSINLGMDKWQTMSFLKQNHFNTPNTVVIDNEDDIPSDFTLPAIVKPAVGGGGSNNTYLVQDIEELQFACRYLVRQSIKTLLQEYIGTPESEYTVGVLHSLNGNLIGSIALRRYILNGLSNRIKVPNRSGRHELSPFLAISSGVSQGEIQNFPEVRDICENIASAIGSKGPLNIQCRIMDGYVYPFEINPRFSGTSYMRALMGFNEPDLLIRHHLRGEKLPFPIPHDFGEVIRGLTEIRTVR